MALGFIIAPLPDDLANKVDGVSVMYVDAEAQPTCDGYLLIHDHL